MKTRHVLLTSVALQLTAPVWAQQVNRPESPTRQETHSSAGMQDIVVTANRRVQTVQTIGLSITAISDRQLEAQGVRNFFDYANKVPNLSFGATGDGVLANRSVAIRGVQGADTTALYIDETPITPSVDPHIIDLDRVEVLRGPQGTLYGARSMGGTIRLITKQPDPSLLSGQVHGALSFTDRGSINWLGEGALNLPLISDRLAVRSSAYYERTGGVFDKATGPRGVAPTGYRKNIDDADNYGGQVALRWSPVPNLSITPRVWYQRTTLNGFPFADIAPNNFVQRQTLDIPEFARDHWTLYSLTMEYKTPFGVFTSSTSQFNRKTFEQEDSSETLQYFLGLPNVPPAPITREIGLKRFVQEGRFSSSFAGPLQFVAGVFYSDSRVPRDYEWVGKGTGVAIGAPNDLALTFIDKRVTKELAFYGEASMKLTQKLKVTAGLRHFQNSTTFSQFTDGYFFGEPVTLNPPKAKERGNTPKVGVEYQAAPDLLLYTSAAKGYRIGGNNIGLANSCDAELAASGKTRSDVASFKTDSLWSYEAGVKSRFADRRVTLNADVFQIDWNNIQQRVTLPSCGLGYTGNAGTARIRGFEVELNLRPMPGLTLAAAAGYNHARIRAAGGGTIQKAGDRLQQVPDWNLSANAEYEAPLGAQWRGFAQMSASYTSNSLSANNSPTDPRIRPAYTIVDMRVGARRDRYELLAFMRNLTNEHANLSDNVSIGAEYPGRPRIVTNRPRTIGVEGRLRF